MLCLALDPVPAELDAAEVDDPLRDGKDELFEANPADIQQRRGGSNPGTRARAYSPSAD